MSLIPNIGTDIPIYEYVNVIIDIFFFIDIAAQFRTTDFLISTGEEITDSKQLATKYIKGRFFLDLMSSIPFEKLSLWFYSDKNRQRS